MQIYILRHGIAEDPTAGQRDADRALTLDGRKKLQATLKRAFASGVAPTLILTSPYKRAMQTAEIAVKALNYTGDVLQTQALTPDADPLAAWEELRLHRDHAQILCASHEPLCGRLAAFLLGAPSLEIDYKKGALIRIDLVSAGPRPRGVLKWLLAPKLV
ncbi:SixA phosphatase family protein [Paludibaculum fermentans]|uniref:Histidine phosphatase family protein n=1 Tax=Paludibaculum fermentans TaxID=1473598 RepID=A0A7S7NQ17_PALFE|nr:histidine phosphatase family protein [Paludibaculum fermentans]QOY87693.1 histidine phosphatase family protein [Paludibaculum fermentans]